MEMITEPASKISMRTLARASFFSNLTKQQLELIDSICHVQQFPASGQIYRLGEYAQYLYVLVEGTVRFSLTLGNRHAPAGEIIGCGEVFGWAALIENAQRRIAGAACITPCVSVAIDGNELLELMEENNSIGYQIMKQLSMLITGNMTACVAG